MNNSFDVVLNKCLVGPFECRFIKERDTNLSKATGEYTLSIFSTYVEVTLFSADSYINAMESFGLTPVMK